MQNINQYLIVFVHIHMQQTSNDLRDFCLLNELYIDISLICTGKDIF